MSSQHSTGPRTPEGKARSSQNARKHGLTAQDLSVSSEQREEFEDFLAQFENEIRPQGALQESLFDELVAASWNLRRIRRMEAALLASPGPELDRLARHKSRIERTFHRSLRELKALQTDAAIALTLPIFLTALVPPLASRAQIAKRTQHLSSSCDDSRVVGELDALKSATRPHRRANQQAGEFSTPDNTTSVS